MRVETFSAGDRNAPEGSKDWCLWVLNNAKCSRDSVNTDVRFLGGPLKDLYRSEAWKVFGYASFWEMCEAEINLSQIQTEAIFDAVAGYPLSHVLKHPEEVSRSAQAASMVKAGTHTQAQAAKELGITQPAVSQNISKMSDSNKSLIIPDHVKSRPTQAQFRKLPPDLQEAVRNREVSCRAAAIDCGVLIVPTQLEKAQKAFGALTEEQRKQFILWASNE